MKWKKEVIYEQAKTYLSTFPALNKIKTKTFK